MKILHVTPYFHGAWAYGGIPRLSFHLAEAQAAAGHAVHVVTTDVIDQNTRRPAGEYVESGVRARVYRNLSNAAAYHLQFFTPIGLGRERRFIQDYDVVHVHGHRNLLNHRMAMMAHAAGVPAVMMPNGTLVNIERRQALKRVYDALLGNRQVRLTSAFIAVSKAEREQFLDLGLPGIRTRVIPNGICLDVTEGEGIDFRAAHGVLGEYILYLGKITPRKGIEHAVAALPLLDDKSIRLVVAGNDMGFESELRRVAARLGVTERVVFTGLLTGGMKVAAYKEARYTVYAGRDEIFGLVPWESILCGTPVIVADDSGCGEWVAAAGAGHVAPYGDPAAIASVVNDRDEAADLAMVERGRAYLSKRLSWSVVAAEMVEYYQRVIG